MTYDTATSPICSDCEAIVARYPKNEEHKAEYIAHCLLCNIEYCVHYSSDVDTRYCGNCLFDFYAETTVISKGSAKTGVCSQTEFYGSHKLFLVRKLNDMAYAEQFKMAMYHLYVYNSVMANIREKEIIAQQQRLQQQQQIKLNMPNAAPLSSTNSTPHKKTKKKVKPLTRDEVKAALRELGFQDLSDAVVDMAMGIKKEGEQ